MATSGTVFRSVAIVGAPLVGKLTTLRVLMREFEVHEERTLVMGNDRDRFMHWIRIGQTDFACFPGSSPPMDPMRRLISDADALICAVDSQEDFRGHNLRFYGEYSDVIRDKPRLYQVTKADLGRTVSHQELQDYFWSPGMPVLLTSLDAPSQYRTLVTAIADILK